MPRVVRTFRSAVRRVPPRCPRCSRRIPRRRRQRPWLKVNHRIVTPLTFGVDGNGGKIAKMVLEDTFENVGQGVALDVFSREDVVPIEMRSPGQGPSWDTIF